MLMRLTQTAMALMAWMRTLMVLPSLASGVWTCNDRAMLPVYPSADELEGDSKDSNCDGWDALRFRRRRRVL